MDSFFILIGTAAVAAAKLLQLCLTLQPHRRQPIRLPRPWDSPGKHTGVGCHFLLQCMKVKVKSLSRVQLLATPWITAYQASPSMGFPRQEYRSRVPLPSPLIGTAIVLLCLPLFFKYCPIFVHFDLQINFRITLLCLKRQSILLTFLL